MSLGFEVLRHQLTTTAAFAEHHFMHSVAPREGLGQSRTSDGTSPGRTKTEVTNATTVIKVMARHDRSGFATQGSVTPLQLRSGASTEM